MRLVSCSGVLAAERFNLSIFSQLWLIENNVLTREETASDPNTYFSPMAVNVKSDGFDLLVIPERAQVLLQSIGEDAGAIFMRILGGIAKSLPHTPYQGVGFNFDYEIVVDSQAVIDRVRECFLPEASPLRGFFSKPDARFGFYSSQNLDKNIRLRLDIKPVSRSGAESILLKFNVHGDVHRSASTEIDAFLSRFDEIASVCKGVADSINEYIKIQG